MKVKLNGLKAWQKSLIKVVGLKAKQQQVPVYIVGGVVRDLLLKRPCLDLDILVDGDAMKLAQIVADHYKARCVVHEQFGTATVYHDKWHVDFTTVRSEVYTKAGALPRVKSGSLREDLFRRDFTINAMAVSIHPETMGELKDEFGGYRDLRSKTIRVLHAQSFHDDATRMLRAVRFECRLGFQMHEETVARFKDAVKNKYPGTITPQRYFQEFRKILSEPRCVQSIKRLHSFKAMDFLNKRFFWVKHDDVLFNEIDQLSRWAKKHSIEFPKGWQSRLRMLQLFSRFDRKTILKVVERYQFSKFESRIFNTYFDTLNLERKLAVKNLKPSQVFMELERFESELLAYVYAANKKAIIRRRITQYLKSWKNVGLKINGQDLLKLGFKPGKDIQRVLNEILYAKINSAGLTRAQELRLARQWLEKKSKGR